MQCCEIRNLRCHVPIALEVNGHHVTTLEIDFVYEDVLEKSPHHRDAEAKIGKTHYEDAKGYKKGGAFELFKLKAQLLYALKKIIVEIV